MTLAQVQATVAVVMALIGSWTALLISVTRSMPVQAGKAEEALTASPKRCFVRGLGMLLLSVLAVVLLRGNPIMKLIGVLILLAQGMTLTVGAAGLAQVMGKRAAEMSGAKTSFGTLVRGSFIYSLAMLFPLIGWYLFLPLSAIFALGAGFTALRPERRATLPPLPTRAVEGQGAI